MIKVPDLLQEIANAVEKGENPSGHTTRDLLAWFGSQRRGRLVNGMIRKGLRRAKLRTEPRFDHAYIDEPLAFLPLRPEKEEQTATGVDLPTDEPTSVSASVVDDPTYRIGKLDSANRPPISINPNDSISEAVTTMVYHDYSQLPVMQGVRDLKGAISWQSIGRALALGHQCNFVRLLVCLGDTAMTNGDK